MPDLPLVRRERTTVAPPARATMAAGNAFSLANMAQAAVEGSRDAASIVKGYQNDGDNQQRMQEFLAGGGDGPEAAGNSAALSVNAKATAKTLLGGGGKTERKKFGSLLKGKLGKKLGRAMGRLNVEHKEKRHVTRRGCVYQFGDGDGSYWDRWMTPARSAKYASCVDDSYARRRHIQQGRRRRLRGLSSWAIQLSWEPGVLAVRQQYIQQRKWAVELFQVRFSVAATVPSPKR